MRTLNVRLLAILVVGTVVVGLGVVGVHALQMKRYAPTYLERAREAAKSEDPLTRVKDARRLYETYLGLKPGDQEARQELAELLIDITPFAPESLGVANILLEQVVRDAPERTEARRKLVDLLMGVREFAPAQRHLTELRKAFPNDAELLVLEGQCQFARGEKKAAEATLAEAIKKAPDRLESYRVLAQFLYSQSGREKEGDAVLEQLVKVNPKKAKAYLYRGSLLLNRGKLEAAQKDAAEALKLAPEDSSILTFAAECAMIAKDHDAARRHAQRLIDLAPKSAEGYLQRSQIELRLGNTDEAVRWMDRGLAATPAEGGGYFQLLWDKASVLLDKQLAKEAEEVIAKLRKLQPPRDPFLSLVGFLQARLDHVKGEWNKALKGFEQTRPAFLARPQHRNLVRLGYLLSADCQNRLGLPELRDASLARVREMGGAPATSQDPTAKARALTEAGRLDDAIAEYRNVLGAENPPAQAWISLVDLLIVRAMRVKDAEKRDWSEVDEALRRAAEALPDDPRVVLREAAVRDRQDRKADAEKTLRDALAARLPDWNRWTELIRALKGAPDKAQGVALVDRAMQDWGKTGEHLARAKKLLETGNLKAAEEELVAARDRQTSCSIYVGALAQMAIGEKDWEKLGRLLDEAEKMLGDTATLRLARARLYVARDGKKAAGAIEKLGEGMESFPEAQRWLLLSGLANEAASAGDFAQALRWSEMVAQQQPNSLQTQQSAFDAAIRAADEAAITKVLGRIERIEGKGPWWQLCQAIRLLAPKDKSKRDYKKAMDHLAQAVLLRPGWTRPMLLAGDVHFDQGEYDAAIKSYREAINLGARNVAALTRFEFLLRQRGQAEEANQIVDLLEEQNAPISHVTRFQRGLADLQERNTEQGLADLNQATEDLRRIAAESDDYRDHVQLARYLTILGGLEQRRQRTAEARERFDEAEQALRRAVKLAPGETAPWEFLAIVVQSRGDAAQVQAVLDEARAAVPEARRPLVLARCYESLGRFAKAEEQYKAVVAGAKPEDSAQQRLARFYLQAAAKSEGSQRKVYTEKGEVTLRKMMEGGPGVKPEDVTWARLCLAEVLLTRGHYADRTAAIALIDKSLAEDPQSVVAQRLKANGLIARGNRRERREARQILEKLLAVRNPDPNVRYELARLLVMEDDWTLATQQMRTLLGTANVQPEWLRFYVQALIQHDELGEAEANLRTLEQLDPGKPINLIFRARILSQRGEHEEAMKLVEDFVNNPKADPAIRAVLLNDGMLTLESLASRITGPTREEATRKYLTKAEAWLRELIQAQPSREMDMVAFLGRHGRYDEALDLAETAWKQGQPIAVARRVAGLLINSSPTPAQVARVEKILVAAIEKDGPQTPLLLGLADLRTVQTRYDEAEDLFRKVLKEEPKNIFALNNLAVFLALRNKNLDESLSLINSAIEIVGPLPALCDSRASVYLAQGQWQQALDDLDLAIVEEPSGTRYFHKARALFQAGKKTEAAGAMKSAEDLGLTVDQLSPLERPTYRQLVKDLQ